MLRKASWGRGFSFKIVLLKGDCRRPFIRSGNGSSSRKSGRKVCSISPRKLRSCRYVIATISSFSTTLQRRFFICWNCLAISNGPVVQVRRSLDCKAKRGPFPVPKAASVAGTAALANTFLPDGGLVGTLVGSAVGGLVGAVHGSGDDLFLNDTRKDFATVRRGAVGAWIGAASGIAGAVVGNLLGSGSAGAIVGSVVGGVVSHKVNDAWFDRRADEYEQFRQWRDR